ncbi:MAG: PAS domain S-box protein [Deltaproteobacteria bacterium]|nr:PAS domain S-box protein [Deltaproteobacteria bacterium]
MPKKPTYEELLERIRALEHEAVLRKKAESKLLDSECKYRDIFHNSLVALARTRVSDGKLLEANERLAEIFGYKNRVEMLEQFYAPNAYTRQEDRDYLIKTLKEKGEIKDYEVFARKTDGSNIWVKYSSKLYPEEGYLDSVLIDITKEKEAGEQLQKSLEQYRDMFQNSLVGLARTRVNDGKLIECNESFATMLGYKNTKEILSEFYSSNAYADIKDRDYVIAVLKKHGEISNYEVLGKKKDGSPIWVKYSAKLYKDENHIDTVVIDISREKTAEAEKEKLIARLIEAQKTALEDTQTEYREMFQNSLVGLSRTRASDGKLIEANERLASMFGYKNREEMLEQFYAPSAYARIEDRNYMVEHIKEHGQINDYEVFARKKDGSNIWVKYSAKLYPEKGYLDVVVVDITKEKEAEAEKEKLYTQLIQSQKMEAIGRLAGGIAHDFKNMLSTIKGMTQYALDEIEPSNKLHKPLTLTLSACESATNLTQQLLIFGRRQPMRLEPMDLNQTVDNMLKLLEAIIPEDITVRMHLKYTPATVMGDKVKLEQVIMNLIINACDAMPEGGTLTVKTLDAIDSETKNIMDAAGGKRFVTLTIEDTGVGMTKEVIERIYEPFFSSKGGHGIGLGMAIVYSVIKEHGGEIRISSVPKRGSVIKIYLPATDEKELARTKAAEKALEREKEGGRILLVEDEILLRESTSIILKENGYEIRTAESAEAAMDVIKNEGTNFDLILSDVVLTGKTGLQLANELREKKIDIPVILCSGYAEQKLKWADIEEKGHVFIEKPYDIHRLLQLISKTIHRSRAAKNT